MISCAQYTRIKKQVKFPALTMGYHGDEWRSCAFLKQPFQLYCTRIRKNPNSETLHRSPTLYIYFLCACSVHKMNHNTLSLRTQEARGGKSFRLFREGAQSPGYFLAFTSSFTVFMQYLPLFYTVLCTSCTHFPSFCGEFSLKCGNFSLTTKLNKFFRNNSNSIVNMDLMYTS